MPRNNKSEQKNKEQKIKKPAFYWFTVIILVVLVIALVITPLVGGAAASQDPTILGRYKTYELRNEPGNIFYRNFENLLSRYEQAGIQISESQAFTLFQQAYNQSIQQLALLDQAESAGLGVSDNTIGETFRNMGDLQDSQGNFSRAAYDQLTALERRQRTTTIREELSYQQVLNDLLTAGRLSDEETEFLVEMASERREFQFVTFDYNNYPIDETKVFATDNADLFRSLEISTITLTDKEQLEKIRVDVLNGDAIFEDQAQIYSEDVYQSENGYRGIVFFHDFRKDFNESAFASTVFSLNAGELSEVLPLANGRHILVRAETSPKSIALESEDDLIAVRDYLLDNERGTIADYFSQRSEAFIERAKETGLALAASEFDLTVQRTAAFPINYGNVELLGSVSDSLGTALQEQAFLEQFFEELFSLALGDISQSFEFSSSISVYSPSAVVTLSAEEQQTVRTQSSSETLNFLYAQVQEVFINQEDTENNILSIFQ